MLIVPIVYPSPWLAAPVWLGFIFLLDPINAQLRRRVAARRPARGAPVAAGQPADRGPRLRAAVGVLELLGAHEVGLHRAGARPTSSCSRCRSPATSGFPAFAVECFVMYVFARHWLWRGSWRPTAL